MTTPSDDLAWPDAEPAEAEWQPAPSQSRTANDRRASSRSRRDDDAPRQSSRSVESDRFEAPTGQPAWSTFEPTTYPAADDDLAYDTYAADEPARSRIRDTGADQFEDGWAAPGAIDEGEGGQGYGPASGWSGGTPADDPDPAEPLPAADPRSMVFADPQRPSHRSSSHGNGIRPPVWGMSGYAWRFARRLTIRRTNRLLRFGASRVLPGATRDRFEAMGLPPTEVDETLRQVRSLDDWAEAWTGTAQRFLGETRRGGDMTPAESARSRQLAALCYHVASFFAFGDDRLARTSRSAATTLFGQSLGLLMPETRRVNVRWRSKTMPGYLTVPSWATGRRPLAVLLNGTTTSREELIMWSEEFLAQGLAVLALDTPGFGDATALGTVSLDNDDIMDGIFELAESDPGLDPTKVSLVGISLGGTMAFRAAAGERRVSAVVAVTPVFEPARWLGASSQVVLAQMVPQFGGYDQLANFVLGLDMPATLAATQAQVLVFGAGRDLVFPAPEASRLAAALGEQATLVWFDDAGHALFDAVPEWTREAAEWLAVVMDVSDAPIFSDPDEMANPDESEWLDDDPQADDDLRTNDQLHSDASQPDVADDRTRKRPPDETIASEPTQGRWQSLRRQDPAQSGGQDFPRMADAPEPQPYGAGVFDASQGEERRSEQQRGYETGVFGPLGPAAARILADEPTPQPGSAEWGYEDGGPWDQDHTEAPWDDRATRPAPSTARLWESDRSATRPTQDAPPAPPRPAEATVPGVNSPVSERPRMAEPLQSEPPDVDATPPHTMSTGNYLSVGGPSVGRGRTSDRFSVVPTEPPDPVRDVVSVEPEAVSVDSAPATDQPDNGPGSADGDDSHEDLATPETVPLLDTHGDTDAHAPFRPPPDFPDRS